MNAGEISGVATVANEFAGGGTVSIGRIFSRAFSFMAKYPLLTFGSATLFGALPAVLSQLFMASQLGDSGSRSTAAMSGFLAVQFFLVILSFILSSLMQAVITRGLITAHEGRHPTLGQCLSEGLRFTIPIVFLTILWWIGLVLGLLLLVIPGLMLICMWSVATPALVEERTGIINAFDRSQQLTKGHRWKIFGLLLVVIITYYLVTAVFAIVGISAGGRTLLEGPGAGSALALIATAVGGLVFSLLWATVQPSLFVELRDAKEGGGAGELAEVFS